MPFRPLNVVGGWYTDDSLPWTQQDCCNYIPVIAEQPGAISQVKAVDAPGLKPFVEIASDGGIRGLRDVEGKLMVVAGTRLYQITNNLVAIPRGTVPGTGLVTMSHNQQGIANELLIGNGSAGYVYNTATRAFDRVIDPGFPGTKASDYLDSFLLGVEPLGRFWFHSDLADAESYNTLDRYEAETSPDRIVTLAVSNEEVVVFGQRTIDFSVNTGAATGTFQSKGVSCNVGCAGTNAVVKLDNTLMWLDNYGVFQRLDGYTPVPISTRALESAIAQFKDRWSGVVATTYQDRGRKIAYWTFPNGLTFGYDVTTRLWHRLQSYGRTNFRAPQIVYWNKKWIAGDSQTGRLYELDWDYMLDVDQPHVRRLKTAPLHGDGVKLQLHAAKLVLDTGGPETTSVAFPIQPDPPTITGDAPDGTLGIAYAGYAYAVAGTAPLTVTLRSGVLPPGITINAAGVLSSTTPTAIGAYPFTLRVTDGNGLYADLADTVLIADIVALLGNSTTTLRPFLLFGAGGTDWDGAYQYNGNTPAMAGLGLLGGGGHWLTWDTSATALAYSTDATGTAWVTSAAVPEAASKLPHGFYDPGTDAFFIPGNGGITRTDDHGVSISKVTAIPAQAIDASETLSMGVSLYELSVATAPAPFTAWTLQPSPHGITCSSGCIVRYGSNRFLIGGSTPGNLPKLTFTTAGASFSTEALPTLATGFIAAAAHDPATKRWVAGTSAGQLIYMDEADGIWHLSAYAMPSGVAVKGIQFDGIQFVAAGNHNVSSGLGIIVTSPTGETWTLRPTAELINAQALAVMK